ncbi:hypothetical protein ETAA8_03460 [Anatilimnocola aggregata]|uniref:DUF1501 domain-containing protein n=1 Tax=Anatilimnocola aggregata TaxID=2528021 RepID=A0A517Y580_9BACT|nr:DUF1501 domain-containing protein [Anatilimnocola aggregata]QDU25282.1 hypothetical protein ETAA8_03460 [Anatilimnocola aggregata]
MTRDTAPTNLSRRSFGVMAGSLAAAASPITALSKAAAERPLGQSHFGRAKRVMLLYLYGAAAQHETWDPKPDAPAEIRGKFNPTSTSVPGLQICEHLPRVAKIADKLTLVRSMSHPYNIHSAAYTMSGIDKVDIPMELNPFDARHWPSFGSVLDYLATKEQPTAPPPAIPRNICLPFRFSSRAGEFTRGGPYGGFLGRGYDPVCTEFAGKITGKVGRWRGNAMQDVDEPYLGIDPAGRFVVSQAKGDTAMSLDQLSSRWSLLAKLQHEQLDYQTAAAPRGHDRFREMAYSLLTSDRIKAALDIGQEKESLREQYGYTLFGQATLAGRRLLEAGAKLVTVLWDEIKTANSAWDTHFHHYERLQDELLPGLDRALSALIADLDERGMLDDTLVLCITEHGRTPRVHDKGANGAGREHWSDVYSNAFAGAGIRRGSVVGSSDKHGSFVQENPISPKDILCTIYHLLGIDAHTMIPDRLGRPLPLVTGGRVVHEMLS